MPQGIRNLISLIALLGLASSAYAQTILNGSFESNEFDCGYNLSNGTFNAGMPSVVAFGPQNEVDVIQQHCGYGPANDGTTFIALYAFHKSDAVALQFSVPLTVGATYHLRFSYRNGREPGIPPGKLILGLSFTNDHSGTMIHADYPVGDQWNDGVIVFQPELAYTYLTISIESETESWTFIDGFRFYCPEIFLGHDTTLCRVMGFNLMVADSFDTYAWNTGASTSSIHADLPDVYWVAGYAGGCVIRDTLVLSEYAHNCACPVYVPNIFTPNGDGINDQFAVSFACMPSAFTIFIYNRWGEMVYTSIDADGYWDGFIREKMAPTGTYAYTLQIQYAHIVEPLRMTGDLVIVH